ncbi:MAG: stage II sporulation protein R, partial [Oscillospiraceae bacterium]|nr:stage II sporulation protein R [Oscillospiraceae bacterium]
MFKMVKRLISLCLILGIVYCVSVVRDKKQLSDHVLRLHVVAASDSEVDQAVKLQVRDAVLGCVEQAMAQAEDKEAAKVCIDGMLEQIEEVANGVLEEQGVEDRATVTLEREAFPVRGYDTFTLPSGVYDSLRVTIGAGQGKNWW